ncbi:MAG: hypothetical protein A2Z38_06090 [Planctomycetes bacterium RBG_19FT_COMBO_48_8]|nr:MAG: hypothetical protein A2Z38_06090 [Planctomycetes bacterium RBG_19FT_COMBO_48_8]
MIGKARIAYSKVKVKLPRPSRPVPGSYGYALTFDGSISRIFTLFIIALRHEKETDECIVLKADF